MTPDTHATTGRWAGRLVQPQNFPRPTLQCDPYELADDIRGGDVEMIRALHGDPLEAVACALRQMFVAERDHLLVVRDYAADCRRPRQMRTTP